MNSVAENCVVRMMDRNSPSNAEKNRGKLGGLHPRILLIRLDGERLPRPKIVAEVNGHTRACGSWSGHIYCTTVDYCGPLAFYSLKRIRFASQYSTMNGFCNGLARVSLALAY